MPHASSDHRESSKLFRGLLIASLSLTTVLVLLSTWLHEDAFITLRVIDNAVHGHGLRWNVAERVQAYTHPLWMLLILPVYGLLGDPWWSYSLVAWAATAVVLALIARLARSEASAALAIFAVGLTRSFGDWSTSGLENSLSHLLLAVFAWLWLERRASLVWLVLVASFAAITRHDSTLYYMVPIAWQVWQQRERLATTIGEAVLGSLPLTLWTVFSVVYYGVPLPNTAYAKLGHGISSGELFRQGLHYFTYHVGFDPLTPLIIIVGVGVTLLWGSTRERLLAVGPLLYLGYVLRIGGDYMAGRFWSIALVCAVLLFSRRQFSRKAWMPAAAVVALALGVTLTDTPMVLGPPPFDVLDEVPPHITDDRAYMYPFTGLISRLEGRSYKQHPWAMDGLRLRAQRKQVFLAGGVGMLGYQAGPSVYIIDYYALTDPLLARLPALENPYWRIGHHLRFIPEGYEETIFTKENRIADPQLREFYEHLTRVTRDPLFAADRWDSLWKLNAGELRTLVDDAVWKRPYRTRIALSDMAKYRGWAHEDSIAREALIPADGLRVDLVELRRGPCLLLELSPTDTYAVEVLHRDESVATYHLELRGEAQQYLAIHTLHFPPDLVELGYDGLTITPGGLADVPSLGNVRLCER